ncbi:MAG: alpha-L-fucosidase, partial [Lentisphaeria bacterium]|nr:alpha-L-fucosidase [Lentisphaeria bacterium]
MAKFDYALFYDFHTLATNPDVGKNFDVEAFTDQVKSCGVDFLTFHARCNQGNAYYNTKIGKRHPSLTYDLIGKLCDSCKRKGIRLSLYFNGHLSEEETLANPAWSDVPMDPAIREKNKRGPFYHQVCYNRFGGHLRDMAVELAQNYDFDGFFFDCLGASDCVCPQCVAEMKEKGYDWNDRDQVRAFSHFSCDRMCRMLTEEIRKVKPDSLFFFNGRPFEEVTDLESHLECECLPTGGWGYDCLPTCSHYMRTIAGKDKSVLNMTGRFNAWGDFGGLRTA